MKKYNKILIWKLLEKYPPTITKWEEFWEICYEDVNWFGLI
jgi:hypothetical protein